jgi:zinc protease
VKYSLFVSLIVVSLFSNSIFSQAVKPAAIKRASAAVKPFDKKPEYAVPFVSKTLPNGLEVIVLQDASVPLVTVELAVRNGSFTESPEFHGLSHLYEHMFFKTNSASRISQCEIALKEGPLSEYGQKICDGPMKLRSKIGDVSYLNDIGQLGINYNGSTREEVVNYYFTTTSQYAGSAIRIIRDAALYPVFDEEEFAREKEVVIGEIDRNESNPFYYLNRTLQDKLFYKYPTRKNPLGTRESIQNSTTEKMRLIQGRYYVPNNSAIVVTGDVDPNEIFKLVEKDFGTWQRRGVEPFKEFPLVEHPPLTKSEGFVVEQPVQNVLVQIGWHGPSIGKDNAATYAADVFSYIITQPDSRFQRNLVDSGLVVAADFGYYTQRNVGPIVLTLVTTPDKAKAALKAAYAEVAQFDKPTYFTDAQLENAKTILESRDLFDREKLSEYVHTLGFWWSSTGIDYFRGYHKQLRSVTRADTSRYIQTYVQGKPHIGVSLISTESQSQARITAEDLTGN